MARITIEGPATKVMSANLGGAPDPVLFDWWDFAKGQQSVIASTDLAAGTSALEVNSDDCTAATLAYAIGQGFTVEGAPIFIKMTDAKYQQQVPVGIHERTYTDPEGNELNRKWSEWKDATHEHMDAADGDKIVPGNSWGQELTSAELSVLLGLTGYTLYLAHEVNALLPVVEDV